MAASLYPPGMNMLITSKTGAMAANRLMGRPFVGIRSPLCGHLRRQLGQRFTWGWIGSPHLQTGGVMAGHPIFKGVQNGPVKVFGDRFIRVVQIAETICHLRHEFFIADDIAASGSECCK